MVTGEACREVPGWIRREGSLREWGDPSQARSWKRLA